MEDWRVAHYKRLIAENKELRAALYGRRLPGQDPSGELPPAIAVLGDRLRVAEIPIEYPPCVYFLALGSEVVYVGQSVNLYQRIRDHRTHKIFDAVYFLPTNREDLDRVEASFIRYLLPPANGKRGVRRVDFLPVLQGVGFLKTTQEAR
jgi:hypothetical protein